MFEIPQSSEQRSLQIEVCAHSRAMGVTADLRLLVHSFYQLKRADRSTARAASAPPPAVSSLTGVKVITVIEKRSLAA